MKWKSKVLIAALLASGVALSSNAFAQEEGEAPAETEAGAEVEAAPEGTEPAETEPAETEPVETEPTEPAETEPAETEPVETEPVETEPMPDGGVDAGAQAQFEPASDHPASRNSFVLAPHVGALFPQLTSDLNTWPVFGLSAGYILPTDIAGFVRPLEIGLDVMYSQPGASGTGTDPNLGAPDSDQPGEFEWELTQRMVVLELYALWRFMPPGEFISAYGMIGPRAYFMESEQVASHDGQDFGPNSEANDEYGVMVGGGVDFAVGPGTLYGALEFGWSDLNQRLTGDSNTGALVLDAGYRLYF